ncbi:hypothetical protein L484_026230 [Morus notabilis]|uniref:Uncharacterized protein n=1 Tax=Morus notabilis TaxID=981085 RepID=W9RUX5_9ROSA|nr:hypothetical protein L484_026230 [Morus notabilis]
MDSCNNAADLGGWRRPRGGKINGNDDDKQDDTIFEILIQVSVKIVWPGRGGGEGRYSGTCYG